MIETITLSKSKQEIAVKVMNQEVLHAHRARERESMRERDKAREGQSARERK